MKTSCGHNPYYAKGFCKRCYETKYRGEHLERFDRYRSEYWVRNPTKRKENNLKKYNLTIREYDTLLVRQEGVCAICRNRNILDRDLYVDHDHVTGVVRGLLCHKCNTSLAGFRDSLDLLSKVMEYLSR